MRLSVFVCVCVTTVQLAVAKADFFLIADYKYDYDEAQL
jgi:hypothetical protein